MNESHTSHKNQMLITDLIVFTVFHPLEGHTLHVCIIKFMEAQLKQLLNFDV